MCISLGYPDRASERRLLAGEPRRDLLKSLHAAARSTDLLAAPAEVKTVFCSEALLDYVQALLEHTRNSSRFSEGLSPRAGLALLSAARAWAWLDARDHVIPEDIRNVLPAVASHRLRAASHDGTRALHGRELAAQLLESVAIP
jgi:MoxR-like ATPase